MTKVKSYIFLFLLLIPIIIIFSLTSEQVRLFSWEKLQSIYRMLTVLKSEHPYLAPATFMSIYILYALLSLPAIFLFALIAGCLFPQPFSTFYVISAATIGAFLLFTLAKTTMNSFFYSKTNHFFDRMEDGFRKNAASYLLFLRLIPLSPFWLVNLSGAFFKVPLWTFVWTTFVGMLPSVIIYTQAGKELGRLLDSQDPLNPAQFLSSSLIIALVSISLLSLIPIYWKRRMENSSSKDS
jgi:uncharacterized membrane protein YdjX (TVP38/TMEM64 family)